MKSYMDSLLTLCVYQWGSRSINLASLQKGICPVSFARSEAADVWVGANLMSLSCSFILFRIDLPFHLYKLCGKHMGSCKRHRFWFFGSSASLGRTQWDLSVVSDLKKRSVCLDVVLWYTLYVRKNGRDLNSCAGSLLAVTLVVFASYPTGEEG